MAIRRLPSPSVKSDPLYAPLVLPPAPPVAPAKAADNANAVGRLRALFEGHNKQCDYDRAHPGDPPGVWVRIPFGEGIPFGIKVLEHAGMIERHPTIEAARLLPLGLTCAAWAKEMRAAWWYGKPMDQRKGPGV